MSGAAARFDNEKRRRPESHERQARLTPAYVLEPIRHLFDCREIELDPCTEPDNPTKACRFFALPVDGCKQSWSGALSIFVNPPYGQARERWIEKCLRERLRPEAQIVLLIPNHTDTIATQRAMNAATSILFVRGRLRFGVPRENGSQEAASHGSMLLGYNIDLSALLRLGIVVRPWKATNG
jgi:hypothetical protein